MVRLTSIAVVMLAAFASLAAAAPPWSAPENVSSAALFVETPDVVVTADGHAIATWRWSGAKPAQGDAPAGVRLAVREPGALEFGPERTAPNLVTPLIPYGHDRLIALDTRPSGNTSSRITLRARFGSSEGTFGRPHAISTYTPDGGKPSLAARNEAVAAWIAKGPHGRRVVRAAVTSSGERFSRPFTLRARGRANDVVAGAALGVVWVAWERAGIVEARAKLTGRRWSPVQKLAGAGSSATTFAAVGSGRRGYLAWLAQDAYSACLRTAVLPAAGTRFLEARGITDGPTSITCFQDKIDHPPPPEGHVLRLVPFNDRDALLAWSAWSPWLNSPGTWVVAFARTTGVGARFAVAGGVSPVRPVQSSVLRDVAIAPQGALGGPVHVMFVWDRLDAAGELGERIQSRVMTLGYQFGPVEDVSDLDRARQPAVAFDFSARRWTTVWSQRIGPDQGVPPNQITTFARSSTQPGADISRQLRRE